MGRQAHKRGEFRGTAGGLLRDCCGLSAVEFAIILPFMLLLYLGAYEVTQGIAVKRMVTLTADTVANLTAQFPTVSQSSQMPDILGASATVLTPYPQANAVVTVSEIGIDANGNATVTWSQSLNGSARATGSSVEVPANLATPNTSIILGETTYAYTPLFTYFNMGTVNIYSSVFMIPRSSSGTVTLLP
jgi:Flp pilus assembly protein TadG